MYFCFWRLAYLPEDIEPKIIHQNLKSSNIMLDRQCNPKINYFGITNNSLNGNIWVSFFESACLPHRNLALVTVSELDNLLWLCQGGCVCSYLAQANKSAGVLSEKSDVYSFGILVMEIICARVPVDHNRPQV